MIRDKPFYEDKLRTRVCGLCFENNKILLVKHNLNGKFFYAPPGGAVEFGESMESALKRELKEETNIDIVSAKFQFITEYVNPPLHAIEIFYFIESWNGIPSLGMDPESKEIPLIQDVNYFSTTDLKKINKSELHHILQKCIDPISLLSLSGFI